MTNAKKTIHLAIRAPESPGEKPRAKVVAAERLEAGLPPWADRVVRVEGAKTLAEAERMVSMADRARALTDEQLEEIEDTDPREAGRMRSAARRAVDLTVELAETSKRLEAEKKAAAAAAKKEG